MGKEVVVMSNKSFRQIGNHFFGLMGWDEKHFNPPLSQAGASALTKSL